MPKPNTVIDCQWLATHHQDCLILDCRAKLGDLDYGAEQFAKDHIPGAKRVDLDQDLAEPPDHRGRHPLPTQSHWIETLNRLGLTEDQQVIVYDDAGGAFAARAWWMLLWIGHPAAAVLDGGWPAWQEFIRDNPNLKLPTNTTASQKPASTPLQIRPPLVSTTNVEEVVESLHQDTATLLDARTRPRWAGIEEPIDPVAGHIPGALCMPFQDNLDAQGHFKSPTELKARFLEALDQDANHPPATLPSIIAYCGSGVTAAHNILAMHIAGIAEMTQVSLYADSWSGWITDPNRPIETEIPA